MLDIVIGLIWVKLKLIKQNTYTRESKVTSAFTPDGGLSLSVAILSDESGG